MGFLNNRRVDSEENLSNNEETEHNQPIETKADMGSKTFELEVLEPCWKLDELILSEETIDAIQQAANTILVASIVDKWLGNIDKTGHRIAVNFYGPPGTGKTCCAEAFAAMLSLKIMKVNYPELESRFVGDTPKNLRLAFRQAQEANALLFFDEADSVLSKRFSSLSQANESYINQTRSTMMMELNNFQGVVVFATNLQENYDDAFVRRIAAHIKFSLPDKKIRTRLWEKYMPNTLPKEKGLSYERLSDISEGFSPADISMAVRQAAVTAAVRKKEKQQVTLSDVERAIIRISMAQNEVGKKPQKPAITDISKKVISASDLPEELK